MRVEEGAEAGGVPQLLGAAVAGSETALSLDVYSDAIFSTVIG